MGFGAIACFWPVLAAAQNTGGVSTPVVNIDHRSAQYRITLDPDDNGQTGFAQRLHYQQAINDDMMWRVVGQTRKTAESDFDFDFVQAELFWQVTPNAMDYQTGLRVDARFRGGDRPEQIGANWLNLWTLSDRWQARASAMTHVQMGDNAAKGLALQTRAQLMHSLPEGRSIGVEIFNDYGRTGSVQGFDKQNHALGPFVTMPITDNISVYSSVLFGLSEAAADTELRFWIIRSFD
ncbi:outer membrane putative beta-barrel porin/alpha-amylase [Litorimonas taeanensis]|uniref:Outer membrane putative beta-barrel porin/alpha-amylase n=2 Tax=Litorimonas taeanensis TaxID=568099 RepID=A0A420WD08_9PROT|nr:outer membrane putative beta-barrel porin/alpha-amylase [Litorimonas taeanensis]